MDQRTWDSSWVVKALVWFTDGFRTKEGTRAGVYGQSVGRKLSIFLGKYATVFQVEIQATLKAIQADKTTSPLVQQCQNVLNISTLDMLGHEEMKSPTRSQDTVLLRSL